MEVGEHPQEVEKLHKAIGKLLPILLEEIGKVNYSLAVTLEFLLNIFECQQYGKNSVTLLINYQT